MKQPPQSVPATTPAPIQSPPAASVANPSSSARMPGIRRLAMDDGICLVPFQHDLSPWLPNRCTLRLSLMFSSTRLLKGRRTMAVAAGGWRMRPPAVHSVSHWHGFRHRTDHAFAPFSSPIACRRWSHPRYVTQGFKGFKHAQSTFWCFILAHDVPARPNPVAI